MTSIAFLSSVNNFVVLLLFVQFFSAPTCIVCSVIVLMTIEYYFSKIQLLVYLSRLYVIAH